MNGLDVLRIIPVDVWPGRVAVTQRAGAAGVEVWIEIGGTAILIGYGANEKAAATDARDFLAKISGAIGQTV